jgi:Cellulase (glycosyl hydrolase family 5)
MNTAHQTLKSLSRLLPLSLAIGLLALCSLLSSAHGATWYLVPSPSGAWTTLADWNSSPFGTGTTPTALSASDNYDLNAQTVLSTGGSTGTLAFFGNQLIIHGNGALDTGKATGTAVLSIPTVVSYGGLIQGGAASPFTHIAITTLTSNANITFYNKATLGENFTIGTLNGSGDVTALGGGGGAAGGSVLLGVTTASAFSGTLYIADGCQFTFNNAMTSGGPLVVEGAGTAVTLNYTVTFAGLTVNGTAYTPGTYTATALGFSGTGSVVVTTAATQTLTVTQPFGVNFSGGESSNKNYPTNANYWQYYNQKGLNLIRVPFLWDYVQPTPGSGTLDSGAMASLDSVVSLAAARGMEVILDMHNYDSRKVGGTSYLIGSTTVTNAMYQQVWQLLAAHFASKAGVYGYDIMNEPHGDAGTWVSTTAQYGVNGVRQSDTTHYVIVEGDDYAGSQDWWANNENLNITDSANLLIYSAHSYWDSAHSGAYAGTYDSNNEYPTRGVDQVTPFVYWLSLKGAKGYIGEFGVPNNVASPDYRWNVALDNFLYYLNSNGVSGTLWGTYNLNDTYITRPNTDSGTVTPNGTTCVDAPAMAVLENYGLMWLNQDIGTVGTAGSTTFSNGIFTVKGSGTNIWNAADSMQYAYQQVSGNCTIIAQVATQGSTPSKAKAVVMIRNDLTPGSAMATMELLNNGWVEYDYRSTANTNAGKDNSFSGPVAPYWLKLVRSGSALTAYYSANGTSWTQLGTPLTTVSLGTNVYIGFGVCSTGSALNTSTFSNVSVTSP